MFKDKHIKASTDSSGIVTEFIGKKLSSLPIAKDAHSQTTKTRERIRNDFPILTQEEIVSEMEKAFIEGLSSVDFFNKKITDDDKKTLQDLGYDVDITTSYYTSIIHIRISWNK